MSNSPTGGSTSACPIGLSLSPISNKLICPDTFFFLSFVISSISDSYTIRYCFLVPPRLSNAPAFMRFAIAFLLMPSVSKTASVFLKSSNLPLFSRYPSIAMAAFFPTPLIPLNANRTFPSYGTKSAPLLLISGFITLMPSAFAASI